MFWQDSHHSLQTLELCTSIPRNKYSFHIAYLFDCFKHTNTVIIIMPCLQTDAFFYIHHNGVLNISSEVKQNSLHTVFGHNASEVYKKESTAWSISFILLSVSWQVRSLLQSEFSIECDLVLSISSIFSFP
jgi:hypothetical protein